MSGANPQMRHDPAQQVFVNEVAIGQLFARLLDADQVNQPSRHLPNRQDKVDNPGADGAARHRIVLGLVRILDEDDAARFLDRANPGRTIRSGAAQNDREAVADPLGHRAKEPINRRPLPARLIERECPELVIDDLQSTIRCQERLRARESAPGQRRSMRAAGHADRLRRCGQPRPELLRS